MTKLFKYLKPYIWSIIAVFFLTIIQVGVNLELPGYMARIIDEGIMENQTDIIFSVGFIMLSISLAGAVCIVLAGYLAARIATGFAMVVREKVFDKVHDFSLVEFNRFSTSSLITRSTNDIQQIQTIVFMMLRIMLVAPLTAAGAIFQAYRTAPSMTWIMGLAVFVIIGVVVLLWSIVMPKFKLLQKLIDRLNLVTRENLSGLRVIRAFNAEKYEEKKFNQANLDLVDLNLFLNRLLALIQPLMTLISSFAMIMVIWVGARLIGDGSFLVGDMIAFMQYLTLVLFGFMMMSMIFIMLPRAMVSGGRVADVLASEPAIKEPLKSCSFKPGAPAIEFRDVTFAYPEAEYPVLKNITFIAESGKTTALIGSTGSGKSTLLHLITRFYDVSFGHVLIEGVDVRQLKFTDLYGRLGYVPQKGVLFSGTIGSNIKYGAPQADDYRAHAAASVAQASEFIDKTKEGLEASIAQGGTNVSGGQKQRLSIARALVKKPDIFLFDDSFSALDFRTDVALRQALKTETAQATVLIVAQRINTVMNADKIIVLDKGKISGIGKHLDLLKNCAVYKEIALSQLSKEELYKY
ncbi:multidrug ABC transporter ATP-binding protein [Candidatus Falkowbacteria bacterium RIFOXYB2_FULL_34_18]|uniref:Multidrug ABC transporter ATP-binding protein n=1 Tax=Candidatus Falkowbacteria bacterium RIFOXYD2_FULL_34_120 TaxID=1798007 RepID=A0A1F5TPV9_9BACT|nr:MAG: multidrug ABC transporter ATP-binding protein [Candidatus Falkowbacteria bacterium RIFOXYB2_FULL_34_18]OGF29264.1 MAG: multidrug ABC transporter ATP-binding protein [Candidatus Falkowbacteria bacterium RIFOXYC12_FULL_34_55]OGF36380.1 MAG: multidrug ABC transporter ATP-binding protein [Candidatus Falkowbacteria bacterium RIFOXYC2_FULL_34_220]OGF38859.1 MAG: multidrug ABC transporter ATP-binding protein [Candidatus Falkowbacteria bacterium RIFOXYD12_FULL_34_57]OGF40878.1 MAG: multidrug AB